MLEERRHDSDHELLTSKSPAWKHKEIYIRALAFRREFQYDFVQWQSEKGDSDPDVHGFLFSDISGIVVGACCFRSRKKEETQNRWVLDWIWICPKERKPPGISLESFQRTLW